MFHVVEINWHVNWHDMVDQLLHSGLAVFGTFLKFADKEYQSPSLSISLWVLCARNTLFGQLSANSEQNYTS